VKSGEQKRLPVVLRLTPDDKALWERACSDDGIESGIAARQVVELMIKRIRGGDGFIEALAIIKAALK